MNLFEQLIFWWRTHGLPDSIVEAQRHEAEYDCAARRAQAQISKARTASERDDANAYAAKQFFELLTRRYRRRFMHSDT
jgi:hypothetical protein